MIVNVNADCPGRVGREVGEDRLPEDRILNAFIREGPLQSPPPSAEKIIRLGFPKFNALRLW